MFDDGQVPSGIRSSIHSAAARAGVRVGVKVTGSIVYMWKIGTRQASSRKAPCPPIKCEVCGKLINRRTGTSRQFVCAGNDGQQSQCQKVWRYAREHGVPISEAIKRCHP